MISVDHCIYFSGLNVSVNVNHRYCAIEAKDFFWLFMIFEKF